MNPGLAVGDEVAAAVLAGVALGNAFTLGLALALAAGEGDGRVRGENAGLGLATGVVVAPMAGDCAATVAAGVVAAGVVATGVVAAVSRGFTNLFGGAFGGGVASVLNFVRARSTADRSVLAVHPLSMLTSTTRSFSRRGRGMSRISVINGTETSSSSPWIRAVAVSPSLCRRRR